MDVGLQTQVPRSLYKGVALVASAGTTNGLPGQMVGVYVPDRAAGGAALSAGPIDAVAHLGVQIPGRMGESGGPGGGHCSDLP